MNEQPIESTEPTSTQTRPGIARGIHAFGQEPPTLAQLIEQARGVRDEARAQAAQASAAMTARANRLEALLTEADSLVVQIESARGELARGEQRLASFRETLGGSDPNASATIQRSIQLILDSVERTFHPQPHDILGLVQAETLLKHREGLLIAAETRWLDAPKQRLQCLEAKLAEIETAIVEASEA